MKNEYIPKYFIPIDKWDHYLGLLVCIQWNYKFEKFYVTIKKWKKSNIYTPIEHGKTFYFNKT